VLVDTILRWARRWRVSVLVGSGLISLLCVWVVQSISFDADVLHLLPRHGRAVPAFQEFLQRFGSLDYLYVVFEAPADHTVDEYEDEIAAFVDKLKALPEIERVDAGLFDAGRDWAYVGDRELLLLSPERLGDALDRFDPARMPAHVQGTRELLSLPSPEITQMVRQDPLGLFQLLRDQMQGAAAAFSIDPSRHGYVTKDGRSRLVLAKPTRPPFDTDFSKQLFARLDSFSRDIEAGKASASASASGQDGGDEKLPPLKVQFAGAHRISLETEREVRAETIWNSVGSLTVILPLLYLAFRSWWLVAVGALPSAIAMLMVLAAYAAGHVTLTAAATGAAAMQFGLGVDGVVLLFVAFRQRVSEGLSADQAALALGEPSSSMLLGMWTTAATFYGLMFIDFPSLQELGALIGHSMVLCGILTLVQVPALFPRRVKRMTPPMTSWWLSRLVFRHARAIIWTAVAVTIALGFAALWLRVDPSLDKLRSSSKAAEIEESVAKRFGLPRDVYLILARGPDLESLLVDNERVVDEVRQALPKVALHAPVSLLPSQARQAQAAARIDALHLDVATVRQHLASAAKAAGFRDDTFAPFLERLPRLLDTRARLTYDGFHEKGLQDLLGRTIVRESKADGGGGGEGGGTGDYVLATYVYPASDAEVDMLRAIAARHADRMTLTGMPEVNRELKARFTPEFIKGLAVGTILVIALIVYSFRRFDLTVLAMVPTVLALIWGAGLLAIARVDLDMFSVFAVMTFVGIGVDYGIHMVHRFHHAPADQAGAVIAQLGPVILVAGAITLLGFGTLVTSSYGPLRSLGLISSLLVITLMISTLLVLPALLVRRLKG
jgi:predicted RND superfamily exporter protein